MQACRLSAKDLSCNRGERLLFAGVSFDLLPGGALQIAGQNGIGKSSLIRILAGLARPFTGTLARDGITGLLDERLALDEHQPLGGALAFWSAIDRHTTYWHTATDHAQMLGLSDLLDVPVRYLSTGQRKRAAMARLLGQNASIWLLDEPLNGLDTQGIALIEALARDHCARGGIAVIASHQPFTLHGMPSLQLAEFVP